MHPETRKRLQRCQASYKMSQVLHSAEFLWGWAQGEVAL